MRYINIITTLMGISLIWNACSKNDLKGYSGDSYIYFSKSADDSTEFSFAYDPEISVGNISLELNVISRIANYDRIFAVRFLPQESTAQEGRDFTCSAKDFVVKANDSLAYMKIEVKKSGSFTGRSLNAVFKILPNEYLGENGEPFGFFHRKMDIKASGEHFVLPRGSSVKMSEDRIYAYDMESYKYSQEKPGNDTSETFDIREYNTGDSIKSIHWKLTAKAGEAMVKEPGFPVENNIMIIYDNCSGGTPENIDKFEDLKVGISKELLERKIPHSIGWYDREHGFRTRFVGEESDFWSALMESEKSEVLLDDRSSIYHFIASEVEKNHSNYIYVSNDDRDIERLREYGEVTEQKTRISQ